MTLETLNPDTYNYIRNGFSIYTGERLLFDGKVKPVYGQKKDSECCLDGMAHDLISQDGRTLTKSGQLLLNRLKS